MRLKSFKKLILVLLLPTVFFCAAICAYCEQSDYGQTQIMQALPDEAAEILTENEIYPNNNAALDLQIGDVFEYMLDVLKKEATKPLAMLTSLLGVALLLAVAEALRDSTGTSHAVDTFSIVGVIAGAAMISVHISECVLRVIETLSGAGVFLGTFIPIFAGIMAVTGQIATAGIFNTILIAASQLFSQLICAVLSPICGCILGVSIAGSINTDLKVERIAELVKKVVVWALGLIVTIFVGFLSLQSVLSSSADTLSMKTAKFLVSNSVPIVGSAVGDAIVAVNGSMGMIRAGTGTFGIIAGAVIFLPSIISVVCYKIAISIAAAISDLFSLSRLCNLLRSCESVISIILAMLISFLMLAVVSIALMLYIGQGGNG